MGGAAPRTRSPAAGRAPPAGGACAVSAAAAPLHSPRGYRGALAPPHCRLFRQLGLFLLSSPVAARQPRSLGVPQRGAVALESPARRVCAVSVAVAARPAPSSPPPPGLVSVSRPSPKARRLVSLSVRPLLCTPELLSAFSLWSPEPSCPSVSFHSSVRSQDGQPLPPSLVACFVCLLPPARPLWDLGQHRTAAWDARTRQCLLFQSSPHPGVGMGPRRLSPPYSVVRGYRASCHLKIPARSLQTVKKPCVKEPSWRTGKSVCQKAPNGCQRHPAKDPATLEIPVPFQDEKEGQQREVASLLPLPSAHLG